MVNWPVIIALRTVYGLLFMVQGQLLLIEKAVEDGISPLEFITTAKKHVARMIKTLDKALRKPTS